MMDVLNRIKVHLDLLGDRLTVFSNFEYQAESWLKTELLMALNQMQKEGAISDLTREVTPPDVDLGRQKIDIAFRYAGVPQWIELKHWLIGPQKGINYGPSFYFGDRSSVGITPDVTKLSALPSTDGKWMFLLLTRNPGTAVWQIGLDLFHQKFAPYRFAVWTGPDQYPPWYYLAALELAAAPVSVAGE